MKRWSCIEDAQSTLLHRHSVRPVWSAEASCTIPRSFTKSQRRRLAHQVRQDIWRANGHVRGFLPVVEVSTNGKETVIRAGASLLTRTGHATMIAATLKRVLDNENNMARWQRYALRASG